MRALFPPHHWELMAENEVFAHVEHQRRTGQVEARSEDGIVLYEVASS